MLETFQEIYKSLSFHNDTDLKIITNKHTISNTASKNINSDVSLQLMKNFKNIKTEVSKELIITLALNGTPENKTKNIILTILADNQQSLAQIILDILTHKEASPTPLQNYKEFFENRTITILLESETLNISMDKLQIHKKLWIHIQSDSMLKANQQFNKICDELYEFNEDLEIYFSFVPSFKQKISIIGYPLEK